MIHTALQSVTYHWTPHGFSLQGWAVIGWETVEHFDWSTTSIWSLLLKIQATFRVCVPFPHSAEHWTHTKANIWGTWSGWSFHSVCACKLPDPRVQCTTPGGSGRGLSHMMSRLVDVHPRSCLMGDQIRDSSGTLLPGSDCHGHTQQSTEWKECHRCTHLIIATHFTSTCWIRFFG